MPGLSHAPASLALSGGEGSCLRSEGRRPRPGRPHPPGRSGLARPHPGGFRAAKNRLAGKSELTPELVDESLRDIRVSLLEADVAFDVVKKFVARVREKAVGESDGYFLSSPGA